MIAVCFVLFVVAGFMAESLKSETRAKAKYVCMVGALVAGVSMGVTGV